jgi:glutamine synthetase
MFLGDDLTEVLDAVVTGKEYMDPKRATMNVGVDVIPDFVKDNTDRNRTSPFAFTGNKFEFRMVGSAQSISDPNIVLNTIVAEAMSQFSDALEGKEDVEKAARELIRDTVKKHARIIFNGNGYSPKWVKEAEERGLDNFVTAVDAIPHLCDDKNVKLFEKHKVYTKVELKSLSDVMLEEYVKVIGIEVNTMLDMAKKQIIPACLSYSKELAELASAKVTAGIDCEGPEKELVVLISTATKDLYKAVNTLEQLRSGISYAGDTLAQATYIKEKILPAMDAVRAPADALESLVGKQYWPFPTYGDLLFYS